MCRYSNQYFQPKFKKKTVFGFSRWVSPDLNAHLLSLFGMLTKTRSKETSEDPRRTVHHFLPESDYLTPPHRAFCQFDFLRTNTFSVSLNAFNGLTLKWNKHKFTIWANLLWQMSFYVNPSRRRDIFTVPQPLFYQLHVYITYFVTLIFNVGTEDYITNSKLTSRGNLSSIFI